MTTKTPMIGDPQEDHKTKLRTLLHALQVGEVDVNHVLGELTDLPFAHLGYATVDHHRVLRQGVPEVIFGPGKTSEQVVGIARELIRKGQNVLATRIDAVQANSILQQIDSARYMPVARVVTIEPFPVTTRPVGAVVLVCAGTADLPVAEVRPWSQQAWRGCCGDRDEWFGFANRSYQHDSFASDVPALGSVDWWQLSKQLATGARPCRAGQTEET